MRRGLVAVVAVVAAFIAAQPAPAASWAQPADQGRRRERAHGPEREQLPRQAERHPRGARRPRSPRSRASPRSSSTPTPRCRSPGWTRRSSRRSGCGTPRRPSSEKVKDAGLEPPTAPGERGRRAPDLAAASTIRSRTTISSCARRTPLPARRPRIRSPARCISPSGTRTTSSSLADSFSLPSYGDWPKRVLRAGRALHRLPVCVGRNVRTPAGHIRRHVARRLRLLGLRLARLQAPGVSRTEARSRRSSRAERRTR